MILSRRDLDWIADNIIEDFQQDTKQQFQRTDIDRLAEQYLRLSVSYTRLSKEGNLLGLTAYDATDVKVYGEDQIARIHIERDTVLLEKNFLVPYLTEKEKQKRAKQRRFTLAHECAHQILFRMEPDAVKNSLRSQYSQRRLYDCQDLKAKEDWNEWQANTLGAALLMPKSTVEQYFEAYQQGLPLVSYGGKYAKREHLAMAHLMGIFDVSRSVLEIRLKALGYLVFRPRWQYRDPTDIYMSMEV